MHHAPANGQDVYAIHRLPRLTVVGRAGLQEKHVRVPVAQVGEMGVVGVQERLRRAKDPDEDVRHLEALRGFDDVFNLHYEIRVGKAHSGKGRSRPLVAVIANHHSRYTFDVRHTNDNENGLP